MRIPNGPSHLEQTSGSSSLAGLSLSFLQTRPPFPANPGSQERGCSRKLTLFLSSFSRPRLLE